MDLYLSSTDDLETTFCFLDFQEIIEKVAKEDVITCGGSMRI